MKNHFILATALVLCYSTFLFGQITFERTYGLPNAYDEAYSIVRTENGQIYTLGSRFNHDNGSLDFLLSALDGQGSELWSKTFGGDENEEGRKLLLLEDGLLLLGYTKSFGEGGRDWYVVKTDLEGTTVWSQTYGGPDRDEGLDAALGASGDILLAGFRETGLQNGSDVWLAVIDSQGNLQADTYLATEDRDDFFCASATADGGWLIGWDTRGDEKLTKISSSLQTIIWELADDSFATFFSAFSDIQEMENGDILVSGHGGYPWAAWVSGDGNVITDNSFTETPGLNLFNYRTVGSVVLIEGLVYLMVYPNGLSGPGALLAIAPDLSEIEGFFYFDEQIPKPNDMIATGEAAASPIYIAGLSATETGGQEAFVLKGSVTGTTEWLTAFGQDGEGGVGDEFGAFVQEAEDGSFYLVSGQRSINFTYTKVSFLKVNALGDLLWTLDYGTDTHTNQVSGISLRANGNLVVLGASLPGQVPNPPQPYLFILEISPQGQLISEIIIPFHRGRANGSIAALPDGSFITAANISLSPDSNVGLHLARWDENNEIQWEQAYDENNENFIDGAGLAYSPFDQTLVCAANFELSSFTGSGGVVKFDIEDGTVIWAASPETETGTYADVNVGPDGDIAASGLFFDFNVTPFAINSQAYWLDASGNELAYQQYSKEGFVYVASSDGIHFLPDNRFWTVGYIYPSPPQSNFTSPVSTETVQGLMTFYDGQGNIAQERLFGEEQNPILFFDGSPASDGGLIAIGNEYLGGPANRDIYLLKTNADGLVSTRFTVRKEGKLNLSPNPSDGRLRFDFQSPATGEMRAELYDMQGRQLWQKAFDKLEETAGRELDFSALPNGGYVFSIAIHGQRYSGQWVKSRE
ncbi:MAG: hypothetical protein KDD09_23415 [Phaeodactylibacter sp.]|nr:hypothetical protein [Phaeodactylibacter sp.]